jgi:beta-glucanase (GH16 family)
MTLRSRSLLPILLAWSTVAAAAGFDPSVLDDFDAFPYLWTASSNVTLDNPAIAPGDPLALPGQEAFERVLSVTAPFHVAIDVQGKICNSGNGVVPVVLKTTATFDAATADPSTITLGNAHETHVDKKTGQAQRHLEDADHDGRLDLVLHFRYNETGLPCPPAVVPFNGRTYDGRSFTAGGAGARFAHPFAASQDWSTAEGLSLLYHGGNTGDTIGVELLDNRAPDPGPSGWKLVWSDEFNGAAGQPPDAGHWSHETGDGTANGIPGWGNNELESYTDSTANASTDGAGHLAITTRKADGSLSCYYGPCQYTSARLVSRDKAEFAHGRIEARLRVPKGAGLWPAFWSLGSNVGQVGWPQSGEIDFMEFVGRDPSKVSGSIHGPGYSGGQSITGTADIGTGVYNDFHTFAVEWQPSRIDWFMDGVVFHSVKPSDVAPRQWVFDHPFFLVLNLAVGGFLGGPVSPDTVFPQSLLVDYVRVYQGPDTAERFVSSFRDDFIGWREVSLPFSDFTRGAEQPAGAPNDGLGLNEVWGYGFRLPDAGVSANPILMDKVRRVQPASAIVVNTNDSGSGSLRRAVDAVASGGTIGFDPGLAGRTISLTTGPLWISNKTLTIDGEDARGLRISGGGRDRVMIVDPGAGATVRDLVMADGWAWDLAGGILDNGTLNLDHVVVEGNVVGSSFNDFWKGGGGIYAGGGSTLNLIGSTVRDNQTALVDGGGVYAFFDARVRIEDSTISGNTAGNTGGGIRMLGNATIVNSTISGNTSAWYGEAIFHTDGVMSLVNSTIAGNIAPSLGDARAAIFVGTFTGANATLTLANTIVGSNEGLDCFMGFFGAGVVTLASGGHNVFTDGSCNATATDQVVGDSGLAALADNGGPSWTHALVEGSPAIDAADPTICPPADQRGVPRPQGPACDVGAFERVP